MVVEAADTNWMDQTTSTAFPTIGLRRLGARHGKRTANGANAWTKRSETSGEFMALKKPAKKKRTAKKFEGVRREVA